MVETRFTPAPHTDRCQSLRVPGAQGLPSTLPPPSMNGQCSPKAPTLHRDGSSLPCRTGWRPHAESTLPGSTRRLGTTRNHRCTCWARPLESRHARLTVFPGHRRLLSSLRTAFGQQLTDIPQTNSSPETPRNLRAFYQKKLKNSFCLGRRLRERSPARANVSSDLAASPPAASLCQRLPASELEVGATRGWASGLCVFLHFRLIYVKNTGLCRGA